MRIDLPEQIDRALEKVPSAADTNLINVPAASRWHRFPMSTRKPSPPKPCGVATSDSGYPVMKMYSLGEPRTGVISSWHAPAPRHRFDVLDSNIERAQNTVVEIGGVRTVAYTVTRFTDRDSAQRTYPVLVPRVRKWQ